jgi:hypothetical protein
MSPDMKKFQTIKEISQMKGKEQTKKRLAYYYDNYIGFILKLILIIFIAHYFSLMIGGQFEFGVNIGILLIAFIALFALIDKLIQDISLFRYMKNA